LPAGSNDSRYGRGRESLRIGDFEGKSKGQQRIAVPTQGSPLASTTALAGAGAKMRFKRIGMRVPAVDAG